MSYFLTRIPIDVPEFKKLLPNGSDFEGVSFNAATNEVEIRWGNRYIVTPYSTHQDFTIDQLKAKELPKCANLRADAVKSVPAPEPVPESSPEPKAVDKKPRKGVKKVV